ncbi:hypothetical protein DFJ74DRAFT_688648 [Hyaloraphidium curvatum]|nr:hypothetical protein DFJ74DRAFT_698242 [Hyaloraphidium curvatum]KAI9007663.1 hypothetical protein DFJ74DRAFT_688648 [Hyaloraphidium curvatum]
MAPPFLRDPRFLPLLILLALLIGTTGALCSPRFRCAGLTPSRNLRPRLFPPQSPELPPARRSQRSRAPPHPA